MVSNVRQNQPGDVIVSRVYLFGLPGPDVVPEVSERHGEPFTSSLITALFQVTLDKVVVTLTSE